MITWSKWVHKQTFSTASRRKSAVSFKREREREREREKEREREDREREERERDSEREMQIYVWPWFMHSLKNYKCSGGLLFLLFDADMLQDIFQMFSEQLFIRNCGQPVSYISFHILRKNSLQKRCSKKLAKFPEKHQCGNLFFIELRPWGLQLYWKRNSGIGLFLGNLRNL